MDSDGATVAERGGTGVLQGGSSSAVMDLPRRHRQQGWRHRHAPWQTPLEIPAGLQVRSIGVVGMAHVLGSTTSDWVSAIATTFAVLAALFGPLWIDWYRRRRRRPRLSLAPTSDASLSLWKESMRPIVLRLSNDVGREKAEDVEVFLTAATASDGQRPPPRPLTSQHWSSIAPGFSRVLLIGWCADSIWYESGDERTAPGEWATEDHNRIDFDKSYRLVLTVTGSNFDAQDFAAVAAAVRRGDQPPERNQIELRWQQPPRPVERPNGG